MVTLTLLSAVAVACDRAPLDVGCPDIAAGELEITEVRGPQDGSDTYGEWIELHNTGAASIPLAGVALRLRKLDGSGAVDIVIRAATLAVPAGGYVVLGRAGGGAALPAHIDYGYAAEFDGELYAAGVLDVLVCGASVGQASWTELPASGTLARDAAGTWCPDTRPADPPSPTELGLPGTPGEENPSCPP